MKKRSNKPMRKGVLWGFSGGITALLIAGGVSMLIPPKVVHAGNCKEIEVAVAMRSDYDYKKVNSISHSLGSIVAQNEAGIHQDVDRVVLTGMTHSAGTGLVTLFTSLYPALIDKKFAGSVTDPSYLTTLPGTRKMFYNASVDPKVLEYDEQNKDMSSATQIPGFPKTLLPPPLSVTQNIKVPTVVLVGAEDSFFCGLTLNCSNETQLKNTEKIFFPNATSFTARSVPATGHNLPLHPSADTSFSMIDSWMRSN